jgi:translation initiation factor 2 subunit 2
MSYETLLEQAYEEVKPIQPCERFEIVPVRGHHEGGRTIISNFSQIACHIRRQPEHLIKFLGKELASSTELSGDRLIISRKLPSTTINSKIKKYVDNFVLCPNCKKPDTELSDENYKTYLKCLACGTKKEIHKI